MTGWIVLVTYLVGWYYGSRLALNWRMQRMRCSRGSEFVSTCRKYDPPNCARPVGEFQARGVTDGLVAIAAGLAWPVLVIVRLFMATVPLTSAEANRVLKENEKRLADQAEEIRRLERQIQGW